MSTVLTHGGMLHDFPKSELRTVWETAAPKLGLSPTAIKYIRMLIRREQGYACGYATAPCEGRNTAEMGEW